VPSHARQAANVSAGPIRCGLPPAIHRALAQRLLDATAARPHVGTLRGAWVTRANPGSTTPCGFFFAPSPATMGG